MLRKLVTCKFLLHFLKNVNVQISGLDLNAAPAEDANDNIIEPVFCTQLPQVEMVGESPDPMVHQQGEAGDFLDEHSGRGLEHRPPPPTAGEQAHPSTTIQIESTTYPEMTEGCADGVGIHEEVLSTPQEPFIGMHFDTLESARAHYNAYAAKIGFSIKANTSK
jgi:hypothetical protein